MQFCSQGKVEVEATIKFTTLHDHNTARANEEIRNRGIRRIYRGLLDCLDGCSYSGASPEVGLKFSAIATYSDVWRQQGVGVSADAKMPKSELEMNDRKWSSNSQVE